MMFGFDVGIISGTAPIRAGALPSQRATIGMGSEFVAGRLHVRRHVRRQLPDAYGRKRTLLSIALVFAFTSVLTAVAPAFSLFVAARFAGGLAVGAASMVSPLYIAEASPYALRGRLVALNQLAITMGILIS